jgi:hypothetical protein
MNFMHTGPEPDDDELEQAVEAGVEAASEEISRMDGRGRRWRSWGAKEMLIAETAAIAAVQKLRALREQMP